MAQTGTAAQRRTSRRSPDLPQVLAVVVTHNGRTWLRDCLVALNVQTYPSLDVLVVDDASPGRRDLPRLNRIAKRHLRRRRWGFLRTPRPLGFGAAANWALARVRTDADMLLFIHDDAVLDPGAVGRMVARMLADDRTGIVGPKIVSWHDPDILEEVGMAIDRLGYPYKGLEQGEIDLGQHDVPSEVFYVTSTCMLVRRELFRQLRGWDARMRAYGEDLDLCWRARLAGHLVRVEPAACARHAIAMATGARSTPHSPARYYIRRNRLRAIAKNVSAPMLIALVPQYVLLTLLEMLAFVVLRQPREIVNLGRALMWNVLTLPQTLTERARVQKRRQVSDRLLRRLQVRSITRLHSYVGGQAERLEQAWGRRAEVLAARGGQARSLGQRLRGWPGVATAVLLLGALLGLRGVLWAPPAAVGELLPYPERATAMWSAFTSPWHPPGLGGSGPAPPALALLGLFPVLTFGAAGAAQKLLLVTLGAVAATGAWRLVAGLVHPSGRAVAALAYVLGGVGYSGVQDGDLGALVLGAAAPFVLLAMLRLFGWVRPPGWRRGRALATIALGGAVSAALVPGALALYGLAAVVLAVTRRVLARGERMLPKLLVSAIGLTAAWGLLLPWSATWFAEGGVLHALLSDDTWALFAPAFRDHGMLAVVLGQTPTGPPLFGLAMALLGLVAVAVGRDQRWRLALALWVLLAAFGWLLVLTSAGLLRPLVSSPTQAGVPVALAFACLAGLGVGAFQLDLPARGLGLIHAATLGALAASGALAVTGAGAALLGGHWDPGRGHPVHDARAVDQIRAVLEADAAQTGSFRALWVGRSWIQPQPSPARTTDDYFLSGPRGPLMTDLFGRPPPSPRHSLGRVIASIEEGTTDRGGELLGAFNVRFVIVERGRRQEIWRAQSDLAIVRDKPDFLVLRNDLFLPRAAVYDEVPAEVRALDSNRPDIAASESTAARSRLSQTAAWRYEGKPVEGPGVVFAAESADDGWRATLGDRKLEPIDGGWGNAFAIPAGSSGRVSIGFARTPADWIVLFALAIAWVVALGAAFSRRGARVRRRP